MIEPLTVNYSIMVISLVSLKVREGGSSLKNIFIALFHVLDYLDEFKAIKENLLGGVGRLDPSSPLPLFG